MRFNPEDNIYNQDNQVENPSDKEETTINNQTNTIKVDIPMLHQFVFIKENTPIYLVETFTLGYLKETAVDMAYVYNISAVSLKDYARTNNLLDLRKDSEPIKTSIEKINYNYNSKSPLAQFTREKKLIKEKEIVTTKQLEVKPPIYSTVITEGVDSFNGNTGAGFYDKEPTYVTIENNKQVLKQGENTGLFITIDSLVKIKSFIPTKDIQVELTEYGTTALYFAFQE